MVSPTIKRAGSIVALLALLGFLVAAPWILNSYRVFVLALIMIYSLSVLGFNALVGWSGQIGLAQAGFMGLGAYGTTLLLERGWDFWVALIVIAAIAAAAGALVGFPAVQLRGFFLAIATLAFGELIVRGFAEARGLTGGGAGMGVPIYRLFGLDQTRSAYVLTLMVSAVGFVILHRLLNGRFGRTLKAVRDIDVATGPIGIPSARYKLMAFSLSGVVGAVAGALFAQLQAFIFPDMFGVNLLVILLVMLLVGGVASISGSVIGAIFGVVVVELFQDLGQYQRLAYGFALILVVRFLPGGIASIPARLRGTRLLGRAAGEQAVGAATADSSRVAERVG
ncbi:branched-chain amino acid ABC transporter permease [Euzebya tangerina]|uniref:branched-chain amino acid ABC transporter permease n=1 Tax=Euzebya tangerina TaxID=591198 RepID=UPI000E3225F1|nr:branched-chain amino acid ABC transporter permease [Euzebya tangerina]